MNYRYPYRRDKTLNHGDELTRNVVQTTCTERSRMNLQTYKARCVCHNRTYYRFIGDTRRTGAVKSSYKLDEPVVGDRRAGALR